MPQEIEKELLMEHDYNECYKYAQKYVNARNDGEHMDIITVPIANLASDRTVVYKNRNYVLLWSVEGEIGNGVIMKKQEYYRWKIIRRHGRLVGVAPSDKWEEQLCKKLRKGLK